VPSRRKVEGSGIALATGPWVTPEMVPRLLELMENPTPPRIVEDEVRLNRPVKVKGVGPLLIKVVDDVEPGSVSVTLAGVTVPINP
jgi:hypothetical protein